MLHVTNGSSVSIAETGIPGDVITWDDVLYEGPVPDGLGLVELSRVRTAYLCPTYEVDASFEKRDARLLEEQNETVLWFEHDLYDQLQLLQILDTLAGQERTPVLLIQSDRYLGEMTAAELNAVYPARQNVTPQQFELARRGWAAFRSPTPQHIETLLREDTSALPFLAPAFRRLLEQYPWTGTGLNRTEHQILDAVSRGIGERVPMFVDQCRQEPAIFMGDSSYFDLCDGLTRGEHPLLALSKDRYSLTEAGGAVLDGREDRVKLNGMDRWIGGVQLQGRSCWRWDAATASMVEA